MPYITKRQREGLEAGASIDGPGELNYLITATLKRYWQNSKRNYAAINDIIGAVEGAKLEFYRRVAVEYETEKIKTNGDVY